MDLEDKIDILLVEKGVRTRYLATSIPEWTSQEREEVENNPKITLRGLWICHQDDTFQNKKMYSGNDFQTLQKIRRDYEELGRGLGYPRKLIEFLKETQDLPRSSMWYKMIAYEWEENGSECGVPIYQFSYRDYSLAQWFLKHTKDWVPVLKKAGYSIEYTFAP